MMNSLPMTFCQQNFDKAAFSSVLSMSPGLQVCGCMAIHTGPAMTAGSTFYYALRQTAIDLGHQLGHSERL